MSFQAYLDNIEAKTGKTPKEFISLAGKKGFLKPAVKAGEIVKWLKDDFGLGHGHGDRPRLAPDNNAPFERRPKNCKTL